MVCAQRLNPKKGRCWWKNMCPAPPQNEKMILPKSVIVELPITIIRLYAFIVVKSIVRERPVNGWVDVRGVDVDHEFGLIRTIECVVFFTTKRTQGRCGRNSKAHDGRRNGTFSSMTTRKARHHNYIMTSIRLGQNNRYKLTWTKNRMSPSA